MRPVLVFLSFAPLVFADTPIVSGAPGNPGIKVRLTKRLTTYVTQVIGRATDALIPQMKIDDLERDFPGIPGSGHLTIANLHIIQYTKAQEYASELLAPNTIRVSIRNMGFTASFTYAAWALVVLTKVQSAGTGVAVVQGFNADIQVAIGQTSDGHVQLTAACADTIGGFNLQLNPSGDTALIVAALQTPIELNAREILRLRICDRIAALVNGDLTLALQRLTAVTLLAHNGTFGGGKGGLGQLTNDAREKAIARDVQAALAVIASNLTIDSRFSRPPLVDPAFIETYHKGEISWKGAGDTPFFPVDFQPSAVEARGKMVYIRINDYVVNSMINALFKHDGLVAVADDKTTPSLAKWLRTTCADESDEFCFGNALPGAHKKYPNHRVELRLVPLFAPYITIGDTLIRQNYEGTLFVSVAPLDSHSQQKVQIIAAHVTLAYTAVPRIVGDRISVKLNVSKSSAKVESTTLDADSRNTFDTLADFAVGLVSERADGVLQRGVPLPGLGFAKILAPVLSVLPDKSISVGMDVEIDEAKFRQAAAARSSGG